MTLIIEWQKQLSVTPAEVWFVPQGISKSTIDEQNMEIGLLMSHWKPLVLCNFVLVPPVLIVAEHEDF